MATPTRLDTQILASIANQRQVQMVVERDVMTLTSAITRLSGQVAALATIVAALHAEVLYLRGDGRTSPFEREAGNGAQPDSVRLDSLPHGAGGAVRRDAPAGR